MNTLKISFASALVFASLALGGCAADAEPSDTDGETADLPTVQTDTTNPRYMPRVTKKDIIQGGGKCTASGACDLYGSWNCSGGGYCSLIAR